MLLDGVISIYFEWLSAGRSWGYPPGWITYMLLCVRDLGEAAEKACPAATALTPANTGKIPEATEFVSSGFSWISPPISAQNGNWIGEEKTSRYVPRNPSSRIGLYMPKNNHARKTRVP